MKWVNYMNMGILSAILLFFTWIVIDLTNQPSPELACREGKLYEVTHEGNITIITIEPFIGTLPSFLQNL